MVLNTYRLCCAMADKQMTASDLCRLSKVSNKSLSLYLSGRVNPRPVIIGMLAKALNVTPEYLTEEAQSHE